MASSTIHSVIYLSSSITSDSIIQDALSTMINVFIPMEMLKVIPAKNGEMQVPLGPCRW